MNFLDKYFEAGLEQVSCNLCGLADTERLPIQERHNLPCRAVICRNCGLAYLNPRWSAASYRDFYRADYRALMGERDEPPRETELRQRSHGAQILEFCLPFLGERSRVLDVGCGPGGVLTAFALAGRETAGVEPSEHHSAYAREQGHAVQTGLFGEVELPAGAFDLVIVTQTLNHLLDPRSALRALRALLSEHGLLFLEVQNFPEFARRARRSITVDHPYYFAAETLECMARRTGLEPIRTGVDTALGARAVHPYMWHRSAPIHVRMLLRAAAEEPSAPLPDYRKIRDEVLLGQRRSIFGRRRR
jgi:SAM-dependent methyltransferase